MIKSMQDILYGERKSILDWARIKIHHAAMLPESHLKEEYLDNSINQYSKALLQKVGEIVDSLQAGVLEQDGTISKIPHIQIAELRTKLAQLEGEI